MREWSERQPEQVSRLARNAEVHGNLSWPLFLADASIEAKQNDRKLAVERSTIVDGGGGGGVGDGVKIRLEHSAALIIEQRALDDPVVEGRQILHQPQRERATAIGKARLVGAELRQLGAACATARLAGDGGLVHFATGHGKRDRRHFAHGECAGKTHFDVIAWARGIGIANTTTARKCNRVAAKRGRNSCSGRSGAGLDVIDSASGQCRIQISSTLDGKDHRVIYPKIGIGRNSQHRSSGRRDGNREVSEVQQARERAGGLHGDHPVLAGQDGSLATGGDGHRSFRPVAGDRELQPSV